MPANLKMPMTDNTAKVVMNAIKITDLPADKVQAMKDMAKKLADKGMKPARVQRKVAEYFHIELL